MQFSKILKILFACAALLCSASVASAVPQIKNSNCALMVIDMQNDFSDSAGKMPANKQELNKIIPIINNVYRVFKQNDKPSVVILNEWTNPLRGMFFGFAGKKGTWGGAFNKKIIMPNGITFSKNTPSAFSNKELVEFLKNNKITTLYVAGVKADQCVLATLKDGKKRGYTMCAIVDGIAADNEKNREKAFRKYREIGVSAVHADSIQP